MFLVVVFVLVVVSAGPEFSSPQASADDAIANTMEVELTVTLHGSDGPVVAHLLLPGEEPEAKPLVDRGAGHWGTTVDLRLADWHVVFEDVSSGLLSEELALTEIGLDRTLLGVTTAAKPSSTVRSAPSPAVVAIVAAAIVVGMAGVAWRLTPRRDPPPR